MIRALTIGAAGIAAFAFTSGLLAKQWVDYSPTKGVWEVNMIDVDPNHVDDYLVGLKRTQAPFFDMLKKRGLVDEYRLLVRNGYTREKASVIVMVHYTSASALEPNKARDMAIDKEATAMLPDDQSQAAVAGYEKYRTFIDDATFAEVTFNR